jgi:hypothetical protein
VYFGSDKLTVSQLIEELEDLDPDAEVRLATQPAWPFEWHLSTSQPGPAMQVTLDDEPVVYLVEGEQLGYLPEAVCRELGWRP